MKKVFLLACAAAFALASCQKEDPVSAGGVRDFRIRTKLPVLDSRASKDGGATNVVATAYDLRYILEVWSPDGSELVLTKTELVKDNFTSTEVDFSVSLPSAAYKFVLWADFVNEVADGGAPADLHYVTTDNLQNITLVEDDEYKVSDDTRDAYYAVQTIDLTTSSQTADISLKRPFGKIRLISTVDDSGNYPVYATVQYDADQLPAGFNAFTGTASTTKIPDMGALMSTVVAEAYGANADARVLAVDYIFASAGQPAVNLTVVCYRTDGTTQIGSARTVTSIPVVANKLTTVYGNFYTRSATLSVSVSDVFDTPDINNELLTAEDVSEVAGLIAASPEGEAVNITVTSEVDADASIAIPNDVDKADTPYIELDLSAGIADGQTLTLEGASPGAGAQYNGVVYITVPADNEGNLTLNMPSATVYINGKLQNVNATTAENTLVVSAGSEIVELTATKGNIRILGTVGTLTKAPGYTGKITWAAADQATFDKAFAIADTILMGEFTLTEDLTIGRAMVIRGLSPAQSKIVGKLTVSKNLTLDGIGQSWTAATKESMLASISVTAPVTLNVKNCELTFTRGTAGDANNVNFLMVSNSASKLNIDNSLVTIDGTYIHSIRSAGAGGSVSFTNSTLRSLKVDANGYATGGAYTRGIVMANATAASGVLVDNSTVKGMYYALQNSDNTAKYTFAVRNSTIQGWAAIYAFDAVGMTFNVSNSLLVGANVYPGPSNGFATVRSDYNFPCQNYEFSFIDTEIRNMQPDATTDQYAISFIDLVSGKNNLNNKVVLGGNTKITYTTPDKPQYTCMSSQESWTNGGQTVYTFNVGPNVTGFTSNVASNVIGGAQYFTQADFAAFSTTRDRYMPAAVNFLATYQGVSNVVKYSVDSRTNSFNRLANYKEAFRNTQGCIWNVSNPAAVRKWEASSRIYVTDSMINDKTKPFRVEMWTTTSDPTEYPLFGVGNVDKNNNLMASGARWRIWSVDSRDKTEGWTVIEGVTVTAGWHTLTITGDGATVNYILDGVKIGEAGNAAKGGYCIRVMPQVYNFNQWNHVTGAADATVFPDYSFNGYFGAMSFTLK